MAKKSYPKFEALNHFEKLVVSEYLTGEHRFNKTRAYRAVKDSPDGHDDQSEQWFPDQRRSSFRPAARHTASPRRSGASVT